VLVITLAANILIWSVYNSFLPVFAGDVLGLGAAGLGRLMLFAGAGNFVGSFIIASLGDFRYKGGVFVVGSTIWGAGWAMFGLSESVTVSYVLMLGIGLISAAFGVLQATLMLMTSAAEVQGRALGILELAIGAMPIGTLLLGAIAQWAGVGPTTFVAGSLFVLILIVHTLRAPDLLRYTGEEAEPNVVGA
jgi:MFS family permease